MRYQQIEALWLDHRTGREVREAGTEKGVLQCQDTLQRELQNTPKKWSIRQSKHWAPAMRKGI